MWAAYSKKYCEVFIRIDMDMLMKIDSNFRKAIHVFSCSNMVFILLHGFLIDISEKYGFWSLELWISSFIVWLLGVLVSWAVLSIES